MKTLCIRCHVLLFLLFLPRFQGYFPSFALGSPASSSRMSQESHQTGSVGDSNTPQWCPEQQIYIGGVVPENAQVQELIQQNDGFLRLFGYGSLCWNPGSGALSKPGVTSTLGRARGYKRCWAQKSTDHRGRPTFPGIVCTLLEDTEVWDIRKIAYPGIAAELTVGPTMTEGVIYLIPPDLVGECLEELDFREKGGYARDVVDVVEDETGETHQALLYRGTPDNPAIWRRALLDLPLAAAVMSVSEGPSGKNDVYLNSLDKFLTDTDSIAAENDDTTSLADMARTFQQEDHLYFLFGTGSNQHDQLLLNRPNNTAMLVGDDAHEFKEMVIRARREDVTWDPPKQLFAGGGHSGLLTESGRLYLWGWNENGQCGDSKCTTFVPLPKLEPLSTRVQTAALGFSHSLVIEKETQKLLAFGSNERGQVCDNSASQFISTPRTPKFLQHDRVRALSAGLFHSAAISTDGELVTFGCSRFGQCAGACGNDFVVTRWKPSDGSICVGVACGRRHTVAVDDRDRIWTFGENKYGQLGRSILGKVDSTPEMIEWDGLPEGSTFVSVDCGWSHTIARLKGPDGNTIFYGWGRNDKGQLGIGDCGDVSVPRRLFADYAFVEVVCGSEFSIGIDERKNVQLYGCGWNEHGNLATQATQDRIQMTMMQGARVVGPPGLYNGKLAIAVGGAHVLAARVSSSS